MTLDGGVNYTDNVSRSQVDEESETIGTAGLLLGITTDRPNLDADVAAHLEYRHYLDDTFDSEVVGGVNAFVAYAFIPERFIWVVEDNFSQISSDITAVDTPDNRENVNFLSTGPDFTIGLTARTSLQLSGRVSDEYYEERETDSQGLSGSLALIRQMSDASSVSLNGSTSETDFDEEVFSDFRIDSAFLRWQTVTERTTLILDGGYDRVSQDDPFNLTEDDTSGGLLARLELSRAVGARSRVGVIAGTGLETPGQGLQRIQDVIGVDPGDDQDAIVASDAYRADYAFLSFNTDWERRLFRRGRRLPVGVARNRNRGRPRRLRRIDRGVAADRAALHREPERPLHQERLLRDRFRLRRVERRRRREHAGQRAVLPAGPRRAHRRLERRRHARFRREHGLHRILLHTRPLTS